MPTDATPAVHPAAQPVLDDFVEKIDAGSVDAKAWFDHALEHGIEALKAAHPDVEQLKAAVNPFIAELVHASVRGLPAALRIGVEPVVTAIIEKVVDAQLAKLA